MTLNEGDLILTGTPLPAKIVEENDYLEAKLRSGKTVLAELNIKVNYQNLE